MIKTPIGTSSSNLALPRWFIKLCRWMWLGMSKIFSVIIIGVALNILASFLLEPSANLNNIVAGWFIQHIVAAGFIGFVLALITILAGLVSRYPVRYREKEVEQLYFKYIEQFVMQVSSAGFSDRFITKGNQIDKVFVNLHFWPDNVLGEKIAYQSSKTRMVNLVPEEHEWKTRMLAKTSSRGYYFLGKSIDFTDLWHQMSSTHPVSIILGASGTGKSMLLYRLALNMARRGQGASDSQWSENIKPLLIPIYVKLRDYADEWAKDIEADLPLVSYLKLAADKRYIPNLAPFFEKSLMDGKCLVMLDGLDEIYDIGMRDRVEESISTFINLKNFRRNRSNYNRLLITSRIGGYNLHAFPGYRHYTLSELGYEQIFELVQKKLSMNANHEASMKGALMDKGLQITIEQRTRDLIDLCEHERGFQSLMKNPLSLTILIDVWQRRSMLAMQKIEIYQSVIQNIYGHESNAKNTLFNLLLEFLAFKMQEDEKQRVSEREIEKIFKQEQIRKNMIFEPEEEIIKRFLRDVQEGIGIFIEQGPDSFGFLHIVFQEYMAARYILYRTKIDDTWLVEIIRKVRHANMLWREPFILATACQSKENAREARRMIEMLLDMPRDSGLEDRLQDIILGAECLIEAEPLAFGRVIEGRIAETLLNIYIKASQQNHVEEISQIEDIMHRWLNSSSEEKHLSVMLMVLDQAIKGELDISRRESVLSLLNKAGWTEARLQTAMQEDEYPLKN